MKNENYYYINKVDYLYIDVQLKEKNNIMFKIKYDYSKNVFKLQS